MNKKEQKHYEALLNYAHHPSQIEIPEAKIESCIVEPIWYNSPGMQNSLCDIIFLLEGNKAIPTEVKRSYSKREKAIGQVMHGKEYCNNVLKRNVEYMVLAFYREKDYEHINIE